MNLYVDTHGTFSCIGIPLFPPFWFWIIWNSALLVKAQRISFHTSGTLMFISNKQMNCTLVPFRRVHDPRAVHLLLSSPSGQTNCYLDMSATMCTKRAMTRNLQSQEIERIPPSLVPPFVCKLFVITVVSDFARTIWIVCQEHLSDLNGC